ncbi:hypothetical protein HEP89_29495 (plasmid) [Labrenzia sp. 5N]|uniref:hypothetical protein n=1 Tax=Labrenzia sp. 5N TaxID=2723402 RepID=UPI0014485088|nr:hypothetical protein [Labrenzia sp. 5N]NKX68274.1 hypothetical protein [Labrenzia sp. 5N]
MVNAAPLSEAELVHPAVSVIAEHGDPHSGLSIHELAPHVRELLIPSREDLAPLENRNDDRLSQKIRNLVSHRTLEKRGLAIYCKNDGQTHGRYVLTDLGWNVAISSL